MSETAPTHSEAIMEMSDQIEALAKVLHKAQAAMGEVFKNANNPAFRSKYADLAAVVEAVVPALNQHGITLLQPVAFDGDRVKVGTVLLHESGQWVRCTMSVPLTKKDAHGVGSATTYGRRFGLQAMSGVAPIDDDGNAAAQPRPHNANTPPPSPITPAPEGKDFWHCTEAGMSAYAAKKEGLDGVHERMRSEIDTLGSHGALREWINDNLADIKRMPQSWRIELRNDCERRGEELGPNPDQRAA